MSNPTPDYYAKKFMGRILDPYQIARVYDLKDNELFSALKKILVAGQRGGKDRAQDVEEAIDALKRWQELESQNDDGKKPDVPYCYDFTDDSETPNVECNYHRTIREDTVTQSAKLEKLRTAIYEIILELPSDVLQDDERTPADRVQDLRVKREETARELERVRAEAKILALHDRAERQAAVATAEELERVRKDLVEARELRDANRSKMQSFYRQLQETEAALLAERVKLAEYEERYRPRRQSEEKAPKDKVVHVWDARANRWMAWPGERVPNDATWTHQPPTPGEGE